MDDVTAVRLTPIFDSPGEMQALPVFVSLTKIGDRECVVFGYTENNPNIQENNSPEPRELDGIIGGRDFLLIQKHIFELEKLFHPNSEVQKILGDAREVIGKAKNAFKSTDAKMHEEWETIQDIHVRHIWKLADNCCDCDVSEEQRVITVSPDWYHQNGVPICPECGSDMEYSHTEIAGNHPSHPLRLVVTHRGNDIHVCQEGKPEVWDCGKTQFEAVGRWFNAHRPDVVKWLNRSRHE